ncbi:hypothetical protein [Nitrospirillum iridis]|uniref:Terminase large subunit gp17-like C-terminal domain-containing protein n=1 Tax=Nitrospirillum iridis TaxID=765888 RepID=A0A7X0EFL0_9PROT|nr:hypothetical protein [Nitrospirillum iridis]MBB6254100.1 hypothetical protein [Nitrospirillum iridis]
MSSSEPTSSRYVVGVDLGRQNDPTAIVAVRRDEFPSVTIDGRLVEVPALFRVGFSERVPLGTPYPAVVQRVANLLKTTPFIGADLVIDQTGVGVAVADMFRSAGMHFTGVVIHGGDAVNSDGMTWRVPKMVLISRLQALMAEDRLHVHADLPDVAALREELLDYETEQLPSGRVTFNAPPGRHDDLVMALAIAVWKAHGATNVPPMIAFMHEEIIAAGLSPDALIRRI